MTPEFEKFVKEELGDVVVYDKGQIGRHVLVGQKIQSYWAMWCHANSSITFDEALDYNIMNGLNDHFYEYTFERKLPDGTTETVTDTFTIDRTRELKRIYDHRSGLITMRV